MNAILTFSKCTNEGAILGFDKNHIKFLLLATNVVANSWRKVLLFTQQ
jgi:hypothetical protein